MWLYDVDSEHDVMCIQIKIITHLYARVSNGTSSNLMQALAIIVLISTDDGRITGQHSLVSINVHANGQAGDLSVLEGGRPVFDEVGHRGGEAGSETSGGHHGDVHVLGRHGGWYLFLG